ncbi:NADH dehydrogenase [ubiquinone] 1 alpha subcomplex subunit 4-like protein [Lachnellula suecica]|uniref:NADH dehydrogenase [ubiquinone] 1 alpha subcomplex subunit 4-like protein n=1 Tax=Lachnellula suecica TaxID=602035 RepID=A0A8T9CM71_9HELO|nr:NADH dehydrogenase [ubiquinone] 1 alpha subcomplex subunit 4-like protein [Lachnellula suecica]
MKDHGAIDILGYERRQRDADLLEPTAHTISQRLRALKRVPPELIPLGIVVAVAVGAAFYSMGRKLVVDKTMRLNRQNRKE